MQTDKDTVDLLRIKNLRTYLAFEALKKGTPEQARRYAYGALHEDELLRVVRKELFASFDEVRDINGDKPLKRWAQGHDLADLHRTLRHVADCPEGRRMDPELEEWKVVFEEPSAITAGHPHARLFAGALGVVRLHPWLAEGLLLSNDVPPVKYETHVWRVKCAVCKRGMEKIVHKVSIKWAEHTLSREWVE